MQSLWACSTRRLGSSSFVSDLFSLTWVDHYICLFVIYFARAIMLCGFCCTVACTGFAFHVVVLYCSF